MCTDKQVGLVGSFYALVGNVLFLSTRVCRGKGDATRCEMALVQEPRVLLYCIGVRHSRALIGTLLV